MDFLEEVSEHLETSVYRARERERDIVYYLWKFMLVIVQSYRLNPPQSRVVSRDRVGCVY